MRPKEVHCICPFLKGKPMNRGEFFELSESGHTAEAGKGTVEAGAGRSRGKEETGRAGET
jgi:hypothetical protein